jgi:4-hydroxybenzoate polyprenyltransferase
VSTPSASVTDYLRLLRLPNVFTAAADVMMGFLFVHRTLQPWPVFAALCGASVLLYLAGMVLNDMWDVEQDRRERPWRPIASGKIPVGRARRLGFALLVGGLVLGWSAGSLGFVAGGSPWRAGAVVSALALCVLLYDAGLKRTPLGPLGMGACRGLNVLLGMSVAVPAAAPDFAGWEAGHALAAGGIALYVAGVTGFARTEATVSRRGRLAVATAVMLAGIALLGLIHRHLPLDAPRTLARESTWLLLLGLIAFTIARRCVMAVARPSPTTVQRAVTNAVWSLIVLDAAVVLLVSPPGWSLVVLSLLIPTVVLGQWIAST